jgi:hypothetical protein
MPVISRFYGIIIKMFFKGSEHNPPHFHAVYGEYLGEFNINTLEMIEGDLPRNARKLVKKWAEKHRKELITIWESQEFKEIEPLL